MATLIVQVRWGIIRSGCFGLLVFVELHLQGGFGIVEKVGCFVGLYVGEVDVFTDKVEEFLRGVVVGHSVD